MTQKDKIKELQKENNLLKEQIELRNELERPKESKPKLEVGKWSWIDKIGYVGVDALINYPIKGDGYGFNHAGEWITSYNRETIITDVKRLATDKEVETALIKEAKKRGFKEGVEFKSARSDRKFTFKDKAYLANGILWNGNSTGIIFENGKWAEIIKDKVPTINGCEMEDDGDIIKFGCVTSTKRSVKYLYRYCQECNVTQIEVENEYKVTIGKLQEVVEYLNKNQ